MKKQIIAAVLATSLFVVAPVYATSSHSSDKMTVCHSPSETGDHCDRYVVTKGVENKHFNADGTPKPGHEQDRLMNGEVDCHSEKESEEAKAKHNQDKEADKEKVTPAVKPEEKKPETPVVAPTTTPDSTPEAQQEQVEAQYETVQMK